LTVKLNLEIICGPKVTWFLLQKNKFESKIKDVDLPFGHSFKPRGGR
jgi:hypothetical protein